RERPQGLSQRCVRGKTRIRRLESTILDLLGTDGGIEQSHVVRVIHVETKRLQALRSIRVKVQQAGSLPPNTAVADVREIDNQIPVDFTLEPDAPLRLSRGSPCIWVHPYWTCAGRHNSHAVRNGREIPGVIAGPRRGPERCRYTLRQGGHRGAETCRG